MCLHLFHTLSRADQSGFDALQTIGGVELTMPKSISRHLANFGEFDTDLGRARILNGGNIVLGLAEHLHTNQIPADSTKWYLDHPCS